MAADSLVVESFVYFGLSLCLVGFRIFCRTRQLSIWKLGLDDYLMVLAMVPYTALTYLSFGVSVTYLGLSNSGMTDHERAVLSPDSDEYSMRVGGSKLAIVGWPVFFTTSWTIKTSLCAFYARLSIGLPQYKMRIYVGYGILATTYLVCLGCTLLACWPFSNQWQINPNPGNVCQPANTHLGYITSMICDLITTIYLLAMPLPLVWSAKLPLATKIGLTVLFSGGVFVIAACLVGNITLIRSDAMNDDNNSPRVGAAWGVREMFVIIATTNLPSTWGWIRQILRSRFGISLSASNKSNGTRPSGYRLRDVSDATWRNRRTQTTVEAQTKRTRRQVLTHGDDSADEILASSSNVGGIVKEVELSIVTSDTNTIENEVC